LLIPQPSLNGEPSYRDVEEGEEGGRNGEGWQRPGLGLSSDGGEESARGDPLSEYATCQGQFMLFNIQ
jgi:hypothetical protein